MITLIVTLIVNFMISLSINIYEYIVIIIYMTVCLTKNTVNKNPIFYNSINVLYNHLVTALQVKKCLEEFT